MIKHIFSDLDGTMLDDRGVMTKENAESVKKSGIPFTLVSARSSKKMMEAINNLDMDGIHVSLNGAMIFEKVADEIKIIKKIPLENNLIKKIVLDVRAKFPSVGISLYDEENWNVDVVTKPIETEAIIVKVDYRKVDFKDYFEKEEVEVLKVSFIDKNEESFEKIADYVIATYGKEEINIQKSVSGYLELTDLRAKKSNAVKYVCEKENLKKEEVMAIGDGQNDIPMLKEAGWAVVMENASDVVKKYANFVTKSNVDSGVAYALENFVPEINLK